MILKYVLPVFTLVSCCRPILISLRYSIVNNAQSSRRIYFAILGAAAVWCFAVFAAPLAPEPLRTPLYEFFHRICHQLDDRSFHMFGQPLAVCYRCSAIYLSFLVGIALLRLIGTRTPAPSRWLFLGLLPMGVDVVLNAAGLVESTGLSRVLTGALSGFVLSLIVVPAAIQGFTEIVSPSPTLHDLKE